MQLLRESSSTCSNGNDLIYLKTKKQLWRPCGWLKFHIFHVIRQDKCNHGRSERPRLLTLIGIYNVHKYKTSLHKNAL